MFSRLYCLIQVGDRVNRVQGLLSWFRTSLNARDTTVRCNDADRFCLGDSAKFPATRDSYCPHVTDVLHGSPNSTMQLYSTYIT